MPKLITGSRNKRYTATHPSIAISEVSLTKLDTQLAADQLELGSNAAAAPSSASAQIMVDPGRILRVLLVIILTLCAMQIVSDALFYAGYVGGDLTLEARKRFMLDAEANIPSSYSALVILLSSVAFGVAGVVETASGGRWRRHVLGLSLVLFFLALDEAAMLHEFVDRVAQRVMTDGGPRWPWVIPYVIAAILFAAAYIPFLRALPRSLAGLFCLAGGLYVLGAAGIDMLEGSLVQAGIEGRMPLDPNPLLSALRVCEEGLEMIAMALLLFAALKYLRLRTDRVRFAIS